MRGSVRVTTIILFIIGSLNNSVKKLDMTNKELFLTFFDVESATIIDIKYRNIGKIQLLLNPTEKNKFTDRLPIRLLIDVDGYYSKIMSNSDDAFNLFKYLGFSINEVVGICREIHQDMGSKKLIVP
jgi:hypothetical protein